MRQYLTAKCIKHALSSVLHRLLCVSASCATTSCHNIFFFWKMEREAKMVLHEVGDAKCCSFIYFLFFYNESRTQKGGDMLLEASLEKRYEWIFQKLSFFFKCSVKDGLHLMIQQWLTPPRQRQCNFIVQRNWMSLFSFMLFSHVEH